MDEAAILVTTSSKNSSAERSEGTRYVLLCRHDKHRRGSLIPVKTRSGASYAITSVGERLEEELRRTDPPNRGPAELTVARCARSPEAQETMKELLRTLTKNWPIESGSVGIEGKDEETKAAIWNELIQGV